MQELQTVLDYVALVPFVMAAMLFVEYAWKRSGQPKTTVAPVEPDKATDIHRFAARQVLARSAAKAIATPAITRIDFEIPAPEIFEVSEIKFEVPPVYPDEDLSGLFSTPLPLEELGIRDLRIKVRDAGIRGAARMSKAQCLEVLGKR